MNKPKRFHFVFFENLFGQIDIDELFLKNYKNHS